MNGFMIAANNFGTTYFKSIKLDLDAYAIPVHTDKG